MQFHLGLRVVNALIVVVYRHRQRNFCALLPDHIVIEHSLQFLRGGQTFGASNRFHFMLFGRKVQFVVQNAGAYADALVADIHPGPRNQLAHTVLRLSAERTFQHLIIIKIRHIAPLSNK